jgi:hypothetical protein
MVYDGRSAAANSPPIPTRFTLFNIQPSFKFKQHYSILGVTEVHCHLISDAHHPSTSSRIIRRELQDDVLMASRWAPLVDAWDAAFFCQVQASRVSLVSELCRSPDYSGCFCNGYWITVLIGSTRSVGSNTSSTDLRLVLYSFRQLIFNMSSVILNLHCMSQHNRLG